MTQLDPSVEFRCSTYGNDPEPGVHHFKGGKWAGIYDFFQRNPDALDRYSYFWFPDDDIETASSNADAFISLSKAEGFELAQPALTPESYFAYRETIGNPRFRFRRTNFVELMMPLMRRDFLLKVLPMFEGKHAALGIDWMWQTFATSPHHNVAIVDACPMAHTRPRNQHLATKMRAQSISIIEERARTVAEYNIRPIKPIIYAAKMHNGVETQNRFRLAAAILLGYLKVRRRVVNGTWTFKQSAKLITRQLRFVGPES